MTLGFSTHIKGKPTYFVDKILKSMKDLTLEDLWKADARYSLNVNMMDGLRPKLHTIRADPKDRWREGKSIHMVINNRTKDRFQFAPVVKCKSVQRIEIKYINEIQRYYSYTDVWGGGNRRVNVYVDRRMLNYEELEHLAFNDGFVSVEAFFDWFKEDFVGKIISWTPLKY